MLLILLTNDDGFSSPGLESLAASLEGTGEVYIVAPENEQSAVAHALTLHRPLNVRRLSKRLYAINGTPTDCVILAVNRILPRRPDIIVSGINRGGNLGDNITYSGTVAAAMEGTLLGIPSVAVSLVLSHGNDYGIRELKEKFKRASEHVRRLIRTAIDKGLPSDTLLNINIPDTGDIRGIKITRQGKLAYDNAIKEIADPWGRRCYWIGGGTPQWEQGDNTDLDAVEKGYISITPVHLDLTNYNAMKRLKDSWGEGGKSGKSEKGVGGRQ
jgi:5'-nucleotidase